MRDLLDAARIDLSLDCRAVSFENPSGARGAGGSACSGRKGAPLRRVLPGERVVLADLAGPGTLRHVWMALLPGPPEALRALAIEVFYDDADEPSISVPCLDFFASPHGRLVAFDSALVSVHEGRGVNAYYPMPFRRRVRVEFVNASAREIPLYYQIDYTLEAALPEDAGLLHASFRRENPTRLREDFTIAAGLRGPGRFLGSCVGVRVLDSGAWYGEGEVKIYRDGDTARPTICGTGLEDYVGTAWGMGPHAAFYAGAPLDVRDPQGARVPDFVGFYRWHLADPIVFARDLRVTLQQIGFAVFAEEAERLRYERDHPPAGAGWILRPAPGVHAWGLAERADDCCATAFVYCRDAQPVPRLDPAAATADVARRPYEGPSAGEIALAGITAAG